MSATGLVPNPPEIFYPESDGLPMSDNTRQFRWILDLAENLCALFRHDENVFVSGNQLWYPVEGEPEIRASPDVYVVFGRPKGHRGSWKQWEENGIPMTVVFEILSPNNTQPEMIRKFHFYEEYGVEEYYIYNPETIRMEGYIRKRETLVGVPIMHGFRSPKLGITFDLSGEDLVVRNPDGSRFLTFEELTQLQEDTSTKVTEAEQRANQAEQLRHTAELRAAEAEQLRRTAEDRAAEAEQRRLVTEQRTHRMAELTQKLLANVATPEELAELHQMIQQRS